MEGNQQKMREAMEEARDALIFYSGLRLPAHLNDVKVHDVLADIETALSLPPRNCDVGTAEEQVARYHAFCYRMMKQNNHCCGPCPCHKFVNGEAQSCTLIWAQMPCEAAEGGAK